MAYQTENNTSPIELAWQLLPDDTPSERAGIVFMLLLTIAQAAAISAFILL